VAIPTGWYVASATKGVAKTWVAGEVCISAAAEVYRQRFPPMSQVARVCKRARSKGAMGR
jgi:hypothetical protein